MGSVLLLLSGHVRNGGVLLLPSGMFGREEKKQRKVRKYRNRK